MGVTRYRTLIIEIYIGVMKYIISILEKYVLQNLYYKGTWWLLKAKSKNINLFGCLI